jgi:lipoprotein-anchoring transpeptidase ErfK/SrfK
MPWLVIGGSVAIGAAMLVAMVLLLGIIYLLADRIPSGVSVAGIDIGGKSADSAATALQQEYGNPSVMVTDEDRSWPLSLSDLGVTLDVEGTIALAEDAQSDTNVQPLYKINLDQTANALVALSEQANVNPNPPENGRAIDIPTMINRLLADTNGELADGVLELSIIAVEPPEVEPGEDYTGPTTTHIVEPGQELALIARQYGVDMEDIVILNGITNPDLLFVGQELIVPSGGIYQPKPEDAPPAPTNAGKAIVVSTGDQRIYAYENGSLVHSHLVSTGRQVTPTVMGDYNIYVKYVADDMAGPDYFLPQVPYVMYFYQGYGIHGTYWHNSFGRVMSHGCVNLPVEEAQWFFNWAEVGTLVRVI